MIESINNKINHRKNKLNMIIPFLFIYLFITMRTFCYPMNTILFKTTRQKIQKLESNHSTTCVKFNTPFRDD